MAVVALMGAGTGIFLSIYTGLPVVEVSNATGRCVRVWTPDGFTTCDHMPERYERVMVK